MRVSIRSDKGRGRLAAAHRPVSRQAQNANGASKASTSKNNLVDRRPASVAKLATAGRALSSSPRALAQRKRIEGIFGKGRTAQPARVAAASSSPAVVQRALVDDFLDGSTSVAIVGEEHDELPTGREIADWNAFHIRVLYESATISSNKVSGGLTPDVTPDPPVLRAAYLWNYFYPKADDFWREVSKGEDVSASAVTMDNHREVAARLRDELEDVGLGVSRSLDSAYIRLGDLTKKLPATNAAFMREPYWKRELIAKAKLDTLNALFGSMQNVHRGSSFGDVSEDASTLMEERSRQMLRSIIAASRGLKNTIYKVGNDHVDDMRRLHLRVGAGVAVLPRSQYVPQYRELRRGSGAAAVFRVNVSALKKLVGKEGFTAKKAVVKQKWGAVPVEYEGQLAASVADTKEAIAANKAIARFRVATSNLEESIGTSDYASMKANVLSNHGAIPECYRDRVATEIERCKQANATYTAISAFCESVATLEGLVGDVGFGGQRGVVQERYSAIPEPFRARLASMIERARSASQTNRKVVTFRAAVGTLAGLVGRDGFGEQKTRVSELYSDFPEANRDLISGAMARAKRANTAHAAN